MPACNNKKANYGNVATITRLMQSTRVEPKLAISWKRAVHQETTSSMNYSRVMSETDFSKSSLWFSLPRLSLAFLEVSMTPKWDLVQLWVF